MGYSMSYDVSVKCHKNDVKGLIHHNARDVDVRNGIMNNHSNENINTEFTTENETYFYNQDK